MSQTTEPLLADKVAWDGDDLRVTDPEVLKKLRRPALSASTAKSFQSCTARWVGERLLRDEEEDPFAPAPLGTSAHAVLEALYGLPAHERTRDRAYEILKDMARVQWAAPEGGEEPDARAERIADRTRWLSAVREKYEGIWDIENPEDVIVVGLETKIENLEINGVPAVGFIDRQSRQQKPRGVIVEDYKSGKFKEAHPRFGDDHGDQIRVYAEAIRVKTGVMPVGGKVLYTAVGRARPVSLSKSNMKKALDAFAKSWDKHNECMDSGSFPVKTGALCSWCPLLDACPAGQREGFEDRTEAGLPAAVKLGIPTLRPGAEPAASQDEPDDEEIAAAFTVTVTETAVAAHIDDSSNNPSTTNTEDEMPIITEGKPFDATVDGELNPNAYAATAAFGLASLAVEEIHKAGQTINKANVTSLARTFHYVSATAQRSWTGSTSLQEGANTRLRGAFPPRGPLQPRRPNSLQPPHRRTESKLGQQRQVQDQHHDEPECRPPHHGPLQAARRGLPGVDGFVWLVRKLSLETVADAKSGRNACTCARPCWPPDELASIPPASVTRSAMARNSYRQHQLFMVNLKRLY